MSAETANTDDVILDDEFFKDYAKNVKEDEKKKGSSFTPRDFEEMKWCGTNTGENLIVRLIGAPPGAKGYTRKPHDPIILGICDVKDNEGKRMQIKLPPRAEEGVDDHIVYQLYDRVNEVTWIKGSDGKNKKVFVNENKHPELFEAVNKTGFKADKDGKSYTYASGLKAQQVVVFNCIDRSDDWCAENKHTKALSKQVDVVEGDEGKTIEYAKTGIPIFGFINKLADQIQKYGNYEKYDVAIKRTGEMTSPYEIRNASKMKQVDNLEELLNDSDVEVNPERIVIGPLTDEEKAYTMYDLTKLMQPTGYRKLLKRIGHVFKLCDATIGTNFEDNLKKLADKEQAEWDSKKAEEKTEETTQATTENAAIQKEIAKEEQPAEEPKAERKRVGPAISLSTEKIAMLKGWGKLKEWEKAGIKDVEVKDGKISKIIFNDTVDTKEMLECTDCNVQAPASYETYCPACSCQF